MEKIYKVKMYKCRYRDRRFVEPIDRLYTSLELMDFVKNTLHEKADTIDDALIAIYNGAGYVNEVIVEFTNDDFIGNIKPDGTMTQKLDLGAFALEVPRSEDLVANFHKQLTEQQKVRWGFAGVKDMVQANTTSVSYNYDAVKDGNIIQFERKTNNWTLEKKVAVKVIGESKDAYQAEYHGDYYQISKNDVKKGN